MENYFAFFSGISIFAFILALVIFLTFFICAIMCTKYLKRIKEYMAFISRNLAKMTDINNKNEE